MHIRAKLKQIAPTLLCFLAAGGVVSTAVLAVKATPEAEAKINADSRRNHDGDPYAYTKQEAIKSAWKYYIPAISVGTGTIICIFGSNILNKRTQASLVAGYSLVKDAYQEYQNKVKELYGEETHNTVMDSIIKDHCKNPTLYAYDFCGRSQLGIKTVDPEVKRTFYDEFSKRYFESTLSDVIQAEYHLNRNYSIGGGVCLNNFYDFLGLGHVKGGDDLSWSLESEIYWIDFNHRIVTLDDGMEVVAIEMIFEPELLCD
ncbi:MAG: hypothetical protein IJ716_14585 [Lachnospiraceae bacterium]|nr:hypothetical protein [Lachnospiraceae bacterium]